MNKLISIAGIAIAVVLVLALIPHAGFSQSDVVCEQDVTVQVGDTLAKIAERVYGDSRLFRAIAQATQAKAANDSSYATLGDLNMLEVGWKLCAPGAIDARVILNELGPVAATGVVDPTVDRVGFPEGYQEKFSVFYEFDRTQNGTARVIYANEAAAAVQPGQPFPYGSVLVMEVYRTQKDDAGNVLLDENGNFVKDELFGLFVMRKERGFGAKYGEQRNGEWEYVAYRPDGSTLTAPENTLACAACHVEASEGKDWVFGLDRHFGTEIAPEPGENEIVVADYEFMPPTLTVKVGSEVKWSSNDVVFHAITASDGSFSGALRPNQSFTQKFEQPGTFEYFSAFYPNVKGTIEVVE